MTSSVTDNFAVFFFFEKLIINPARSSASKQSKQAYTPALSQFHIREAEDT
ncbi:MAG: hypothetical protein LBP31_00425 [Holosporales bacterium]|jgi:hypothetical protein|nr:hypothetical protein [Holosporales bacterium]